MVSEAVESQIKERPVRSLIIAGLLSALLGNGSGIAAWMDAQASGSNMRNAVQDRMGKVVDVVNSHERRLTACDCPQVAPDAIAQVLPMHSRGSCYECHDGEDSAPVGMIIGEEVEVQLIELPPPMTQEEQIQVQQQLVLDPLPAY